MDERKSKFGKQRSLTSKDTTDSPSLSAFGSLYTLTNVAHNREQMQTLMDENTDKMTKDYAMKLAAKDDEISKLKNLVIDQKRERDKLHGKLMEVIERASTSQESKSGSSCPLINEGGESVMLLADELKEVTSLAEEQHMEMAVLRTIVINQNDKIKELLKALSQSQLQNVRMAAKSFNNSDEILPEEVMAEQPQEVDDGNEERTQVFCVNNVTYTIFNGVLRADGSSAENRFTSRQQDGATGYSFEESTASMAASMNSDHAAIPRTNRSDSDDDLYSSTRTMQPVRSPVVNEDYICPLCSRTFSRSLSTNEFEQHVNTHFTVD